MRIAISGASGMLGTALGRALETSGDEVVRLVRRPVRGPGEVAWDPARGELDARALDGVDAVVNLAGESIGDGRWTDARKERIRESRLSSTGLLARAVASLGERKPVLVSASGTGRYGDSGESVLDESAPAGSDFLAEVCEAWEQATAPAADAGARVVILRLGLILSPDGGALAKMLTPYKLGLGGRVGSGKQWMSWVAIDDVFAATRFLVARPDLAGPFNVTTPAPVTNDEFGKTLARVLGRPALLPLPAFAVRAMFGEMGEAFLLAGQRLAPARLEAAGFRFEHPALEPALRHVLGR